VARATKAVLRRPELGGPLFVAAVIGVLLLASRAEGEESSSRP
jgi:F0F1-type ATP synthase membrane subunit c/vacuolar-type H+-ATPase subunit K